jgi:hypothetical protein
MKTIEDYLNEYDNKIEVMLDEALQASDLNPSPNEEQKVRQDEALQASNLNPSPNKEQKEKKAGPAKELDPVDFIDPQQPVRTLTDCLEIYPPQVRKRMQGLLLIFCTKTPTKKLKNPQLVGKVSLKLPRKVLKVRVKPAHCYWVMLILKSRSKSVIARPGSTRVVL